VRLAWAPGAFGAAILLFVAASDAAPRVAVVLNPNAAASSGYETQLRSELQAAGFEVVSISAEASTPEQLEAIAVQSQSVAAISLAQPSGAVSASVWVTERITGKTLLRAVRPEKLGPEAPSIIALRAVELLRASLLELNEAHAPRGALPVPPSVRAWVAPRASSEPPKPARTPAWGIAVGPGLLASPGGIPAEVAPSLGFLWHPTASLTGELRWEGPYLSTVNASIGSASVSQSFITFRARYEPFAQQARFSPWGALGLGGHHMRVHGSAHAPYAAGSDSAYTFVGLAGLGMRIRLGAGLFITPEVSAVFAANRPVVRFADQTTASAGRPWLSTVISLEYAW
jgi:hypothetical protein